MQVSAWAFIKGQWTRVPPVEKGDLTGKTVIVIGANTGIGYETAKHFATMNPARLIMGCRNQAKGTTALASELLLYFDHLLGYRLIFFT